jgi:dihydrolipoamide dehydrogenase
MDIPRTVEFEHAIIATGSRPTIPPPFLIDDPRIMNSTSALDIPDIPGSLLVIGGGYIGLEIGTVYASLGSRVTVVEIADGLAPGADRDLIRPLHVRLEKHFESILLKTKVEALKPEKNGIVATLKGPNGARDVVFDRVLVSVGRRPNTSDLNLKSTKVQLDEKGFIQVDKQMRTDDPRIFAIGDAAGEPLLAHKASREGKVAAEVIAGNPASFDSVAIPAVVFTDPEVAWCGLTENEARAKGIDIVVEKFPWAASGRALTIGRSDGLTKLIMDPQTERLLGVGIVGVGAGDLISEGVLAVEMAAVARDVADIIHPHPTLSETVAETAELFFGQATHVIRPKKER